MKSLITAIVAIAMIFSFNAVAIGNTDGLKDAKAEEKTEVVTAAKPETKVGAKTAAVKDARIASVLGAKCTKCHKGDKDVKKINEAKGIKIADEMIKLIRQGTKAKLHEKISDKELKAAGNELFAKKKATETKKKDEIKTETEKKTTEAKKDEVRTETEKKPEKPKKKALEGC